MSQPADQASDDQRALRLLVVDDHEVVRQGLVSLLERRRFEVVAQAGTVAEALEQARRHIPDLVLMDVRLPDGSGIEACRDIRAEFPTMPVVFLTTSDEDAVILSAIVAGASGYVLKRSRASQLVNVLVAASHGESLLDPAVTGSILERLRRMAAGTDADENSALSSQERKILALVAEGMTNKQIGERVFLSDKTVKNYVSSILAKLHLSRRAQAAAFAVSQNGAAGETGVRWPPDQG